MGGLDGAGRDDAAIAVGQVETVAGVGDEHHLPAHVRAGADRGRDAHVGRDAEGHDPLGAEPAQPQVEVGADEGRIDALRDDRLALLRREAVAEVVAPMARRERGARLHRIVADMDDRRARPPASGRAERGRSPPFRRSSAAASSDRRSPRWTSIGSSTVRARLGTFISKSRRLSAVARAISTRPGAPGRGRAAPCEGFDA